MAADILTIILMAAVVQGDSNTMATRYTPLFSRILGNIQRMTVAVAVIFLFFQFFSYLKSQMERMRLGAEDGRNGARFILKREKKGKNR